MSFDLSILNSPQRQAVETVLGPVLILAGAGTGKTRVITFRIAQMIRLGVEPGRVVAMTFTNKAAREMRERLAQILPASQAKKVFIGTFHRFCLRVLREFYTAAGLEKNFNLVGTSDQIDLVRRALEELDLLSDGDPQFFLGQISKAKNALLTPQDLLQGGLDAAAITDDLEKLFKVYSLYEKHLQLNHAIDFDDCIFKVSLLLKQNEAIKSQLSKRHPYFLVDEFQDTNFAQLKLIELLCVENRNICVVGDDDQSIYSWRGALVETILHFEEIFPERVFIKLEQNYRCSSVILEAANKVIQNNTGRKDKVLWCDSKIDFPLSFHLCENEADEAKWIGEKINALLGEGYVHKDVAILYRANMQARALELSLRDLNIPYKVFGGSSFFERKEVKDFMSYLRLIAKPQDRLAFFRVVNVPTRGIGMATLEKIDQLSKTYSVPPLQVARLAQTDDRFYISLGRQAETLSQFARNIDALSEVLSAHNFEDLGNQILRRFGLCEDILAHNEVHETKLRKVQNLKSLPIWLQNCARDQLQDEENFSAVEFLDRLTLNERDISDLDEKQQNKAVSLMTIHAAKGLEFPCVFIAGVEEDLLPHKNSVVTALGIAEERRLFYVAMTRAKLKLHLTAALERGNGHHKSFRTPSRFLKEIPKEIIDGDFNKKHVSHEEKKDKFLSSLAQLKKELMSGVGKQ